MAPSRRAVSVTRSSGTNRNSAAGSTKRWISHGQAIRSTRAFLRVTHFIAISFAGADVAPLVSGRAPGRLRAAGLIERGFETLRQLDGVVVGLQWKMGCNICCKAILSVATSQWPCRPEEVDKWCHHVFSMWSIH